MKDQITILQIKDMNKEQKMKLMRFLIKNNLDFSMQKYDEFIKKIEKSKV